MAKGRTKLSSDDSIAPAQLRSLRSRKREHLSTEISETENVHQTNSHQDTEVTNTAVDAAPPQCPEEESAVISTQQHQAEGESSPTKQDPVTEETTADTANVRVQDLEEKEKENVTDANRNFHTENDVDQSEKEEEKNRNVSQICPYQPHVVLRVLEDSKVSAKNSLVEQGGANEDSSSNLEKSQETSLEETSSQSTIDVKTATKEAAAEVPARKKRRMGMCGLTEKERSLFLQTKKSENEQKEPETAEMLIEDIADPVVQTDTTASSKPPSLSNSMDCVSEENTAAVKPHSGDYEEDNRAETERHITEPTSDGTSTACDPGCPEEKSLEVVVLLVPHPEQTTDSKLNLPAVEGVKADHGQKESEMEDQSPAITRTEQTEDHGKLEEVCLPMNGLPMLSDEKKEEFTCDEEVCEVDKADLSSPQSLSEKLNCGSVVQCEVAVTLCGSEGNYSFVPDEEPDAGLSPVTPGPLLTRNTDNDLFGPGCMEYVSDSQLNTISLTEEEATEGDEVLSFSGCHEDASELICGLVRELSSLNRKVMATQKELENLRRSTKSSRGSTR